MNRLSVLQTFRSFYGSGAWASKKTGVAKTTISQWLHGTREHGKLAVELPKLAAELLRTNGKCIGKDINGPSARDKVTRIRAQRKGPK